MIQKSDPPFEWADRKHPINTIGSFYFGICDGFTFDEEKVRDADENFLWKLYALIQTYWLVHYEEWDEKSSQLLFNMRNKIHIKESDVGKNMLEVYEEHFDWK
ncbi:hypothetical protein SDC9_54728 [bioreactor metagenome]|uniref:Uncharacterized protein n=1 Tax=bioreactor metagenome TaxID=1076179 RepID=A0A644WWX8_9ZZZZ